MSRSIKKAVIKVHGPRRKDYHKAIRAKSKVIIKKNMNSPEDIEFEDPKVIINDYDYTEYISNCEGTDNCRCMKDYNKKRCTEK